MKCPLLLTTVVSKLGVMELIVLECGKRECAWWNETQHCCAVVNIAHAINNLWADRSMRKVEEELEPDRE